MHYYLVSDLHMGGDAELQTCDYAEEFIQFLQQLSQIDTEAELIIGGDTFGFWELTELEGPEKLDEIIHHHQPIFNQIKQTGTSIKVTMMVGNHDYDLACNPVYVSKLADYNITLDTSLALVRPVADRQLWIEHGQQDDNYNASPQYGNPYALPIGYFITEYIVSGASHYSAFGQGNWLKDIRSVGTLQIPEWIASNYFYREMSGIIRWMVLPFLLLFGFTFIAIGLEILRYFSLFDINLLVDNTFPRALGLVTITETEMADIRSRYDEIFAACERSPGGFEHMPD
ncbi:MAG: metallophosphoesterase, partial [Chloroflexota bacterium]